MEFFHFYINVPRKYDSKNQKLNLMDELPKYQELYLEYLLATNERLCNKQSKLCCQIVIQLDIANQMAILFPNQMNESIPILSTNWWYKSNHYEEFHCCIWNYFVHDLELSFSNFNQHNLNTIGCNSWQHRHLQI